MRFRPASHTAFEEYNQGALQAKKSILSFGVDFLDDALSGILPDDLVLLGAPSGVGKTQLCCTIATANMAMGKRVHYIALEAGAYEIERRLKFSIVRDKYFSDPDRSQFANFSFANWMKNRGNEVLAKYEIEAAEEFDRNFGNLFLLYKQEKFGDRELVDSVLSCSDETDLILIDHVHYFDFDDDNENRAIRNIAKTVRTLALEEQKPIILVAHLRKRDRANEDLVAGLEEFHGSSDLYKIATKVITLAPGQRTNEGTYETFFRAPKNRLDGGVTRYIARELFNPKTGAYDKGKYKLGWCDQKRSAGFAEIDRSQYPEWSRVCREMLPRNLEREGVSKLESSRAQTPQRMPYCD